MKTTARFVRPRKGLPLTFLIIGQGKSIGGEDMTACKSMSHQYRVTLSKAAREEVRTYRGQDDGCMKVGPFQYPGSRLTFDFWSSIADAKKGIKTVTPYDVLACISGDVNCPETFADFCGEYGYETDSIKALQMFRRCDRFGKRLRAFFTAAEIEALSEIQ